MTTATLQLLVRCHAVPHAPMYCTAHRRTAPLTAYRTPHTARCTPRAATGTGSTSPRGLTFLLSTRGSSMRRLARMSSKLTLRNAAAIKEKSAPARPKRRGRCRRHPLQRCLLSRAAANALTACTTVTGRGGGKEINVFFSAENLLENTDGVLRQCFLGGGSLLPSISADVRAILMTSSHPEGRLSTTATASTLLAKCSARC